MNLIIWQNNQEYFSFSDLNKEMSKNSKWGGLMPDGAMIEHNGLPIVVFQINFINKREDIINICGIIIVQCFYRKIFNNL